MNFDIHHFADIVVWVKFGFGINAGPEKKRKKHVGKKGLKLSFDEVYYSQNNKMERCFDIFSNINRI